MLLYIFLSFMKVGFFSFGGGYVMLPLVEIELVQGRGWISYAQLVDIIAIAEMTPGPFAINIATFSGYTIAGIPGALAATTGVVLPSLIIINIIAMCLQKLYRLPRVQAAFRGMRPAIIALIASVALSLAQATISLADPRSMAIALASFGLLVFTRVNPLLVILGAGAAGLILYL